MPAEVIIAYSKWKHNTNKLFLSPSEDKYRLSVFQKSFNLVKSTNSQNLSYKLSLNKFACTTWEEYITLSGSSPTPEPEFKETQNPKNPLKNSKNDNLDKIDWGAKRRVALPRQISNCPISSAIIATMLVESVAAIKNGKFPTKLSAQQIIDCHPQFGSDRCFNVNTAVMYNTLLYVKDNGIGKLVNYPIQSTSPYYGRCKNSQMTDPVKIKEWKSVKTKSDFYLEKALNDGPTANGMWVCPKLMLYSGGIFDYNCMNDRERAFNYNLIIGYDRNEGWWKFRSYHGKDYGEKGDVRLKKVNGEKGTDGICGIFNWPRMITKMAK
jgi:hypothetical protein